MIYYKLNIQRFADGKVVIETDLNDKGFKNGLTKIKGIASKGFKTMAVGVGAVSTAMAGALGYGVKYNAEIEQLQTSFEVMTGSASEATKIVQKLKDVGAKTPYELKGLAQTTQMLMQYGFTAEEAYNATTNLGDIAQGSAEKMQGIALAYGQMSSAGKVNMQDIKQMINQGFNPLQAIADMTGETMEEVTQRYEEGTISVEDITKAMQYASSENGKYYKSMEKQSKTLAGQLSTLKDNASSLAGTLSKGLSNSISNNVLPSINNLLVGLEEAYSEKGIGGFAQALGNGIANVFTSLAEGAPKFIEVAMSIIDNLIKGFEDNLPKIVDSTIKIIATFINSAVEMLPEILQLGIDLIVSLATSLAEEADTLIPKVIDGLIQLILTLTEPENIEKIIKAGIVLLMALIKGLIKSIPNLLLSIPKIIKGLVDGLRGGIAEIKNVGKDLISGLWKGITDKWDSLKDKVKDFGKGVVNKFKSVFGIHSPSTVMRDQIGKFLAEGMGVGFEKELDNVYSKMQNAIADETVGMKANVKTSGTYQMAMAGNPTFNLLDNTSNYTRLEVNGKVLAEVVNSENRKREVAKA